LDFTGMRMGMKKEFFSFSFRSIKYKIVFSFGLLILAACLVLAWVGYYRASSALKSEAMEAMQKVAKQAAETVDSRVQARICVVEALAGQSVIRGKAGDRESTLEEKLQVLRQEQKRFEKLGFKEFSLVDREGNGYTTVGAKVNVADREYFRAAVAGKTAVSSTIVSKTDGSVVLTFNAPVYHYATGEVTGVLTGVVDAARLSELVGSISYARTGYAVVVDSTGKTIAHKDYERVKSQENILEQAKSNQSLAPLASIVARMARGEEGVAAYTFGGQQKIIAFAPVNTTGWAVSITAPVAEVMEKTASLKRAMALASALIVLAALGLTLLLSGNIARPIADLTEIMEKLAKYDFTFDEGHRAVEYLKRKDEIGQFARSMAAMQTNVIELVKEIQAGAQNLAAHSQELAASAEEVSATVEEVASTTAEVASMAERSLENASLTAEESKKVAAVAQSGGETVEKTVAKIRSIASSAELMGRSVQNLGELSSRIGNITNVITGIAEQTNLLALNAAIEAARAGEQGRGFAVVAEEVRKLAEQSAAAAKEIGQLIGQIQSGVKEAVAAMEGGAAEVKEGVDMAAEAGSALKAITGAIQKNIELLDEILQGAKQASEGTQQLAASNQQVTSTIQQVAGSTQQLAEIAGRLQSLAGKFKV